MRIFSVTDGCSFWKISQFDERKIRNEHDARTYLLPRT